MVTLAIGFSPAEALFTGQNDDITAFLRENAVSVDILVGADQSAAIQPPIFVKGAL